MFAVTGPKGFSRVLAEGDSETLGRGKHGIEDMRCSREHAQLRVQGGRLLLTVVGANPACLGVRALPLILLFSHPATETQRVQGRRPRGSGAGPELCSAGPRPL